MGIEGRFNIALGKLCAILTLHWVNYVQLIEGKVVSSRVFIIVSYRTSSRLC